MLRSEADAELQLRLKSEVMPVFYDFLHSAFVQSAKLSFRVKLMLS